MPDEKGVTLRAKLIQAEYAGAPLDPRLENEPLPLSVGAHLLDWFWSISAGRSLTSLGMGACYAPLEWSEIESWSNLKKIDLTPWDVDVIKALDAVYLKIMNKPAEKSTGAQK